MSGISSLENFPIPLPPPAPDHLCPLRRRRGTALQNIALPWLYTCQNPLTNFLLMGLFAKNQEHQMNAYDRLSEVKATKDVTMA